MPKTAIITACFNAPTELIYQHFVSIDMQHDNDIVHVVVDDASTEKDTRIALVNNADMRKGRTVLIKSDENKGPGAARNRAVNMIAKMKDIEYVCLLDIDDYFENDALKMRKLVLEDNKELLAVYGDKFVAKYKEEEYNTGSETQLAEVSKKLEHVPAFDKPRLFNECYIPSCSVMFRWEPFYAHVRYFREDVRLCEDWLIWRKLALLGKFKKINLPIYTQTMHGSNLTTDAGVLANHRKDMITTQLDLDEWVREHAAMGILKP